LRAFPTRLHAGRNSKRSGIKKGWYAENVAIKIIIGYPP
jgi:hypothetical protein